jgi:predicted dehydrogenase
MAPIRFGIIGAGGIVAKLHLPELAAMGPEVEVALIAGRKESRLRTLMEKFSIQAFTTRYEDVLADDRIDAVIVATPHTQHASWAVAALRAGKHVLIQKPLCDSMAEADRLVEQAEEGDRVALAMPHFMPMVYDFRRRIDEGAIGRVGSARCRTSHGGPDVYYKEIAAIFGEAPPDDLWFFDARQASVGALFDMGVYAVANLVALMGTARSVIAATTTFDKPTTLEDTAALVIRFESGAVGVAETSWCDPARTWELSVHGTAGKLVAHDRADQCLHYLPLAFNSDRAPVEKRPLHVGTGAGNVHEHFVDCVRHGRRPPLSHVRAARHVTEILLAGLESGRTGRAVEIRTRAD